MLSFTDSEFVINPYPALKELRQAGKPIWHEESGLFLAARYKDANQVLRTRTLGRIFQERKPVEDWETFTRILFWIQNHLSTPDFAR